jgi:hypothetical protein
MRAHEPPKGIKYFQELHLGEAKNASVGAKVVFNLAISTFEPLAGRGLSLREDKYNSDDEEQSLLLEN